MKDAMPDNICCNQNASLNDGTKCGNEDESQNLKYSAVSCEKHTCKQDKCLNVILVKWGMGMLPVHHILLSRLHACLEEIEANQDAVACGKACISFSFRAHVPICESARTVKHPCLVVVVCIHPMFA